jgi:hypothetical protein
VGPENKLHLFVRCFLSPQDDQRNVWDEIEYQKKNLEETDEAVNHHVKGISGDGIPSILNAIYPIAGKRTDHGREKKQDSIHYRAPHEECSDGLNFHNVPPVSFLNQA